jgi:AcrR family transcriptional regulator
MLAPMTLAGAAARPPAEEGATTTRPLRADARRNRARILEAARLVFASQGLDAQMDDVARRAEVGVGTVYRHFPTKERLLRDLVRERLLAVAVLADAALAREDAWAGFCELMWGAAEINAHDRLFSEAMATREDVALLVAECGLAGRIDELMARARHQGGLRPDAGLGDIRLAMCGLGAVVRACPEPGMWHRYLSLVLDGLRAS